MTSANDDNGAKRMVMKIKKNAKKLLDTSVAGVAKDMAKGADDVGNAVKGGAVSAVKKMKKLF